MTVNLTRLFLLLSLPISISHSLETYTTQLVSSDRVAECFVDDFYDCDQCDCSLPSPYLQIGLLLSFLSFLSTSILVFGFCYLRRLRETPGDIIFMMAFAQFLYSISWMLWSIIAILLYDNEETEDSDVCHYSEGFVLFFKSLFSFYNLSFFFYIIQSMKKPLRKTKVSTAPFHIAPWILAICDVVYRIFIDGLGLNIYGECAEKTSKSIVYPILKILAFAIVPAYSQMVARKHLPKGTRMIHMTQQFLRYYNIYVIVTSILFITMSVDQILVSLFAWEYQAEVDATDAFEVIRLAGAFIRTANPIFLTYIRLNDPLIKRQWKKLFSRYKWSRELQLDITFLDSDYESDGEEERSNNSSEQNTPIKYRMLSMQSLKFDPSEFNADPTIIEEFQQDMKVQIVYSILSAIQLYWSKKDYKSFTPQGSSYKEKAEYSINFDITESILNAQIPELMKEVQNKKYKIMNGTFTAWGPDIFNEILDLDDKVSQFEQSLDLANNFTNIQKAGVIGGGKSGEFFFFSFDNNLIIKTISDEELRVLIEILPDYPNHYKSNPFSILTKIYGAFTFEMVEPYEKYNLILMKNINGYPTSCIERKYDLKGSTVARETIKSNSVSKEQLKDAGVLKDIDFNRFENKLDIDPDLKEPLFEVIKKDVQFLRSHEITDYSLAIYVINKEPFFKENPLLPDPILDVRRMSIDLNEEDKKILETYCRHNKITLEDNKPFHPFLSIKMESENLYYHIGLIDYLCRYGFKKQMETLFKKITHFNPKLDVSSQNANYYAERFLSYMKYILT